MNGCFDTLLYRKKFRLILRFESFKLLLVI